MGVTVKYFDVNRMIKLKPRFPDCEPTIYICFEDIIGVAIRVGNVDTIYTTGDSFGELNWKLEDFENEIKRAIEQTMNDQNEHLKEFENKVKEEIVKIKNKSLYEKTDKISDSN
jgi:gas vesicle protein